MKDDTIITHSVRHPERHFGVVNTPVFRASTILNATVADLKAPKGLRDPRYGRRGTPTTFTLEDAVAELEGADGAVITPSGLSAVTVASSEERRVGKGCVRTCRSRWSPNQ